MAKKTLSPLFHRFLEEVTEIDQILRYSIDGISRERDLPKIVKVIKTADDLLNELKSPEEYIKILENAEKRASFANSQLKEGFSTIYSHAVVAIWSSLEAFIEDIIVESFIINPTLLQSESILKIKIPLSEYDRLTPDERYRYIISEISRQTNAELRQGIKRFEILLGFVNLSGPVDEELRKTFIELCAIRNVIVHRASIIDRKLIEACPWLNLQLGEKLKINPESYDKYRDVSLNYMLELLIRYMVREGKSREEIERLISKK
jgi:hypothetical protein